MKKIVYWRIYY